MDKDDAREGVRGGGWAKYTKYLAANITEELHAAIDEEVRRRLTEGLPEGSRAGVVRDWLETGRRMASRSNRKT